MVTMVTMLVLYTKASFSWVDVVCMIETYFIFYKTTLCMQSASLSTEGVGPAGGGAGDAQHGVGQRVGGGGVGPRSKCQTDNLQCMRNAD